MNIKVKEGTNPQQNTLEKASKNMMEIYPHIDFSEFIYKGYDEKSKVFCRKHSLHSEVRLRDIIKGEGALCSECIRDKRLKSSSKQALSLGNLIKKSEELHGLNKFDFTNTKMGQNQRSVIYIKCLKHSEEFKTTSNTFLSKGGFGCPKCGFESRVKKRTDTVDEFIEKARIKHGDKYDYSKVKYINALTNVDIVCPKHGVFSQKPGAHVFRDGCPKCSGNCKLTLQEAIERAKYIHKDKYIYIKSSCINTRTKTIVECPKHGEWEVSWNNHIGNKSGCPTCAEINKNSRYLDQPTTFYYLKYKGLYKIGITIKSIKDRYINKELNKEEWKDVEILYSKEFNTGGQAFVLEQNLISKYKSIRYQGTPIFRSTGNSEVFIEDILGMEALNMDRFKYFNEQLELASLSKEDYKKSKETKD